MTESALGSRIHRHVAMKLNTDLIKRFGPAAIVVLCLLFWHWQSIAAPQKPLVFLLSLAAVVLATYSLLWRVIPADKSLQDMQYERFQRLQGLYAAIPASVRNEPANRGAAEEFERQAEQLKKRINEKTSGFTDPKAAHDVHNLYLAFLQIVPIDSLALNIQTLESDYRQAVGITAYEAYLGALLRNKPDDPALTTERQAQVLRANATFLVNETRRQDMLKQHIESATSVGGGLSELVVERDPIADDSGYLPLVRVLHQFCLVAAIAFSGECRCSGSLIQPHARVHGFRRAMAVELRTWLPNKAGRTHFG
jgi:uncharacterized short protein YbdD (DUF466 family)